MTVSADATVMPAREPALEIAEFDEATVVFDPRSNSVHLLEALAAVLFDACDGVTDRDDLITEIAAALDQEATSVTEQLDQAIRNFGDLGLLDGVEPAAPPPCLGCRGATGDDGRRTRAKRRRFPYLGGDDRRASKRA